MVESGPDGENLGRRCVAAAGCAAGPALTARADLPTWSRAPWKANWMITSATASMTWRAVMAAIPVMAIGLRRCSPIRTQWKSPCHTMGLPSMVGLALSDPVSWRARRWPRARLRPGTGWLQQQPGTGCAAVGPSRGLAGPRWPAAGPLGTLIRLPASGSSAWWPRSQAGVAMVVRFWRRSCWRKSVLAGVLARFDLDHRFRLFKQILGWTGPKIRAPHAAECPPAGDLRHPWERPAPPGGLTRPGSAGVLRTSAGPCPAWPVHRSPANLDRAATLKARRECAAQVKRQAQTGSLCKPGISRQPSH